MNVDEPRRDVKAVGVDMRFPQIRVYPADLDDPPVRDGNVSRARRRARTIDDRPRP